MKYDILKTVNEIDSKCRKHCKTSASKIHGIDHLRQVAYWAGRFAISIGACMKTAIIGGYLHDCAREDDGGGTNHVDESAKLANRIIEKYWHDINVEKIHEAIFHHADGFVSDDPIVGCIWDADRMTLTRLGIMPKLEFLSTTIAKRYFNVYIKHSKLFVEIQRISSLVIEQINKKKEVFLAVWCGELSKYMLQHILILVEKPLGNNLSKLKILSLYEFSGLSKTHDQSTCYQLFDACRYFVDFSPRQILCPLHDDLSSIVVSKSLCCILAYEYPYSPNCEEQGISEEDFQKSEVDSMVRDYRSRFFERYTKTPKYIHSVPFNTVKNIKQNDINKPTKAAYI